MMSGACQVVNSSPSSHFLIALVPYNGWDDQTPYEGHVRPATRLRVSVALSAVCLPLLSACTSYIEKLVQPRSGATAECNASGFGWGSGFAETALGECTKRYESRGYVPLDKLTSEQRADLERRGLLPQSARRRTVTQFPYMRQSKETVSLVIFSFGKEFFTSLAIQSRFQASHFQ